MPHTKLKLKVTLPAPRAFSVDLEGADFQRFFTILTQNLEWTKMNDPETDTAIHFKLRGGQIAIRYSELHSKAELDTVVEGFISRLKVFRSDLLFSCSMTNVRQE
jgi:hypothetical protein